jgi:hypothetical protein
MWVMITSSMRAASMSSRARPSRGLRMILRLRRPGLLGEAGVDHEDPLGRFRHPEKEVERHRPVVHVAKREVLGRRPVELGVFDRKQLVSGR